MKNPDGAKVLEVDDEVWEHWFYLKLGEWFCEIGDAWTEFGRREFQLESTECEVSGTEKSFVLFARAAVRNTIDWAM